MIDKEFLMIPGPTPLAPRVLAAMGQPIVNHRGPAFKKKFGEALGIIKELFNCGGDVYLVPSSGTGAMELTVMNFTAKDDRVVVVDTGIFGERFGLMNTIHGRNVTKLEIPWGRAVRPEEVVQAVKADPGVKAVYITHNETSSTVLNDVRAIAHAVREVSDAFIIVDAVSSAGITRIDMDGWGLDVVVTSSQKGLMSPPGIAIVAASKRAVEYASKKENESYYFDVVKLKENADLSQSFTTFPVSDFMGFYEALKMLREEGYEHAYARHLVYRDLIRSSLREIGITFVADDADASPCVTGVFAPEGTKADEIISVMRDRYNVEVAGGQKHLKGKAFRIGHMGFINTNDLLVTVSAFECTLKDLGLDFEFGAATRKFLELRRTIGRDL